MKATLKKALARTPLYHPLRNCLRAQKQARDLETWEQKGRPCPPPHIVKQNVLKSYAREYGLRVFVETGTYLGDMVEAMRGCFDQIYSIELSEELFRQARARFARDKHIEIIHGDSGVELGKIVENLEQPSLFWLDGHYSAGITARGERTSPVLDELNQILRQADLRHVIVIDDARCFGTQPGYPSMEMLRERVLSLAKDASIEVDTDSIRLTSAQQGIAAE